MDMATKVSLHGAAGDQYTFTAHDSPGTFRPLPAVYMIACRSVGGWKILHVGECADLKLCFAANDIWQEAVRWFGATHVLTYFASRNDAARKRIARDLILAHDPVMHVSHRASTSYAK